MQEQLNALLAKAAAEAERMRAKELEIARKVMADSEFALFLKSQRIEPEPQGPEYLREVYRRILSTDPAIVKLVKEKIDVQ